MANLASVNYIKVSSSHHFKFNYSEIKDLQPEHFVSSPVFHALGNEWVIDCYLRDSHYDPRGSHFYPRDSCRGFSGKYSFLVRLHGEYKTVNPTISLSHMMTDGTTSALRLYQKRDEDPIFKCAIKNYPFEGQVFAYSDCSYRSIMFDISNNGSFELICTIDNTDIPHSRCSFGVPKSCDLQSQIGKLLESSEIADVTFCVENRSFVCHRLILAARSPVFKAMLFGNMAEATQQQIKIADMCPEVFEAMLHFIYADSVPGCSSEKISTKLTQQLFVAADRYALEGLTAICEDKLCYRISLDTVTTTLAFALQHNSPRLKKACLDFIAEPGTLISWMLTDEYVDFGKSFPSIIAEIRGKIKTALSFRNIKIQ